MPAWSRSRTRALVSSSRISGFFQNPTLRTSWRMRSIMSRVVSIASSRCFALNSHPLLHSSRTRRTNGTCTLASRFGKSFRSPRRSSSMKFFSSRSNAFQSSLNRWRISSSFSLIFRAKAGFRSEREIIPVAPAQLLNEVLQLPLQRVPIVFEPLENLLQLLAHLPGKGRVLIRESDDVVAGGVLHLRCTGSAAGLGLQHLLKFRIRDSRGRNLWVNVTRSEERRVGEEG